MLYWFVQSKCEIFLFFPPDQHVILRDTEIFLQQFRAKSKKRNPMKERKIGWVPIVVQMKDKKSKKSPKIRFESAIRAVYSEASRRQSRPASRLSDKRTSQVPVRFISAWGSSSNHSHIHSPSSQSRRDELVLIILYTFPASESTSVSHNSLSL